MKSPPTLIGSVDGEDGECTGIMLLAYGKHIMDTDQVKSGIKHLFALYYATDLGYPPGHPQFMSMLQLALIGDSSGKDKLVKTTVALVNKLGITF